MKEKIRIMKKYFDAEKAEEIDKRELFSIAYANGFNDSERYLIHLLTVEGKQVCFPGGYIRATI